MSKELFERYREEEIMTMVSMPYPDYKELILMWENPDMSLIKHYYPENRKLFEKSKEWKALNEQIKGDKDKLRDIEFNIKAKL